MLQWIAAVLLTLCVCGNTTARAATAADVLPDEKTAIVPPSKDPYKGIYAKYTPAFLHLVRLPSHKTMKLSTEQSFFTLNMIHVDERANALVKAALDRESKGRYRDALKMYQLVIDKFPHQLYRVSKFGVFVPISQYCQRRILNFPAGELAFYRTLHDARAKEAFEQARRKHSLIGLSEIVDNMLATSYGSPAISELGNAALDSGHYLAALESFRTIRAFFPAAESTSRELDLKVEYCRKMLGAADAKIPGGKYPKDPLSPVVRKQLERLVQTSTPELKPFHSQLASAPHVGMNDYTLFPASKDPMALEGPQWSFPLPRGRTDFFVFSQPVVTDDSVIYRHDNVVYSRSILNGEFRWVNDLGGRAKWQHFEGRKYPLENVMVQDGLVFTAMSKGGPSLVALDQVTGQVKWAYGPVVASTVEESRMRFETAPVGGPRSIFAGYVLDNIEGDTHTDTEYGIIAFESTTGRILWRKPICRLAPGKFSAGFAVQRRNRIRSFISPPLYSQGTVYYSTNAGSVAALDARSGRVKWLMRYPYSSGVHDATRGYGKGGGVVSYTNIHWRPHSPMFWLNQRPLLIGERLYVLPVDAGFMMCIDRRTGKVQWTRRKGFLYDTRSWRRIVRANGNFTHFLGALKTGELVFAHSFMKKPPLLVDPKTGKTIWPVVGKHPPKLDTTYAIERETSPCMSLGAPAAGLGQFSSVPMNGAHYEIAGRPMLSEDGKLYMTQWNYHGWPFYAWTTALSVYDLAQRKIIHRRRFYSERLRAYVHRCINEWAPKTLKGLEELPHKDNKTKGYIKNLKKIVADTVPTNPHPSFLPFTRMTFKRYGVQFELRFGTRTVGMVYDKTAVRSELAKRTGPQTDFAKAELAFAEARYADAAKLLNNCLRTMSSEDQDFRASVNQQLYRVHKRLTRAGIRSGDAAKELANCLGMSRTATTLADEIETLFALAEAYERQGNYDNAARCLRSVVSTYGHHEYPIAELAALDRKALTQTANTVLDKYGKYAESPWFGKEFGQSMSLLRRSLPLYFSTVSPLDKPLTLRAGELATGRLLRLQGSAPAFKAKFAAAAAKALTGRPADEQLYRLWEYPGTPAAQAILTELFAKASKRNDEEGRLLVWQLADVARVCGLTVPKAQVARITAPTPVTKSVPIQIPQTPNVVDLADENGINWLALQRRGQKDHLPQLVFVGGRVRKRLDNKFVLACFDLAKDTKKPQWRLDTIRLKGTGQEPGFFHAFVYKDLVLVNGLYDVLAYEHQTGKLRWRYRVPFNFEIKRAVMSGDILVLSGKNETVALHVNATSKAGEVIWQQGEMGDLYCDPYFVGSRFVTVRKNPYNVTVRYRATGKLMGRLELPDLSTHTGHPLIDGGPKALPVAHDGPKLVVTNGWYYLMVDTDRMAIDWKRRIDANDATREPAMRLAVKGSYLTVLKEDYDQKVIYMLSSKTGDVLWHTDPKNGRSPQPLHSVYIDGQYLYGLGVYPGQGFYFVKRECKTGKLIFQTTVAGYAGKPAASLVPWNYNGRAVVRVKDRQDFELNVFDMKTGKRVQVLKEKGVGAFGRHGNVSATVQNGRIIFMAKDKLDL
jgi:outer membrane protein assembly factor BamB/tetratricopeptide (TPR) repeat protein